MIVHSLTDQLGLLSWEKHVDVVWVNGGGKILIAVGQSEASNLTLPSVDIEIGKIRIGSDGGGLPGDVAIVCALVDSEPVEGAGVSRSLGSRGLKGKAIHNVWPSRLAAENSADNAHVEIVGSPTRRQAKQARGLTAVR